MIECRMHSMVEMIIETDAPIYSVHAIINYLLCLQDVKQEIPEVKRRQKIVSIFFIYLKKQKKNKNKLKLSRITVYFNCNNTRHPLGLNYYYYIYSKL